MNEKATAKLVTDLLCYKCYSPLLVAHRHSPNSGLWPWHLRRIQEVYSKLSSSPHRARGFRENPRVYQG